MKEILEPDGLFIEFKQQNSNFQWLCLFIYVQNTNNFIAYVVYFVYSKYFGWDKMGI